MRKYNRLCWSGAGHGRVDVPTSRLFRCVQPFFSAYPSVFPPLFLPRSHRFPPLLLHFGSSPKHPMISLVQSYNTLHLCPIPVCRKAPQPERCLSVDSWRVWHLDAGAEVLLRWSWEGPDTVSLPLHPKFGFPPTTVSLCSSGLMVPVMALGEAREAREGYYLQKPLHPPCLSVPLCGCADKVLSHNLTLISRSLSLFVFYGPFLIF